LFDVGGKGDDIATNLQLLVNIYGILPPLPFQEVHSARDGQKASLSGFIIPAKLTGPIRFGPVKKEKNGCCIYESAA